MAQSAAQSLGLLVIVVVLTAAVSYIVQCTELAAAHWLLQHQYLRQIGHTLPACWSVLLGVSSAMMPVSGNREVHTMSTVLSVVVALTATT